MLRQPIVTILGHVDAGKTTLLDRIRSSNMAGKEAGGITQSIGSTEIPAGTINLFCKELLNAWKIDLKIPGLLFVDTPGHSAFVSLRQRGGSLADLAVVMIDIKDGLQPQTKESIEILKTNKTPFIIALNKIDLFPDWKSAQNINFIHNIKKQAPDVKSRFDTRLYEIVGELYDVGVPAERYDRISDFSKNFAIVPISATSGEGLSDLIMLIAGLSQHFLKDRLEVRDGPGRGTILEINETKGFGTTLDAIIYDGVIKKGQRIAMIAKDGAHVTIVKCILKPNPLEDIRSTKRFQQFSSIAPSTGIKLVVKELTDVIPGSTFISFDKSAEEVVKELEESEKVLIDLSLEGVVAKADSLGSLEALAKILSEEGIPIKKADIGDVTKPDILDAQNSKEEYRIILGFNVSASDSVRKIAHDNNIDVLNGDVIYSVLDSYKNWKDELQKEKVERSLNSIARPAKFVILGDHVFRKSGPLIIGIEVIDGILNVGSEVMNDVGEVVGKIQSLQDNQLSLRRVEKGMAVAASIDKGILGKNVNPDEILFSHIKKPDYLVLQEYENFLQDTEKTVLKEILTINGKRDPRWKLK